IWLEPGRRLRRAPRDQTPSPPFAYSAWVNRRGVFPGGAGRPQADICSGDDRLYRGRRRATPQNGSATRGLTFIEIAFLMDDTTAPIADAIPAAADDPASRPVVTLMAGGHRRIEAGHPWVYSNEVQMDAAAKALPPGSLVTLKRADGRSLGVAMFNPHTL